MKKSSALEERSAIAAQKLQQDAREIENWGKEAEKGGNLLALLRQCGAPAGVFSSESRDS